MLRIFIKKYPAPRPVLKSVIIAVLGGVGRGTGDVARILENGNLYYSGYEFSKTK